jgi:putative ABC transport system permease protein
MKLLTLSQLRFFRLAPWSTLTVLLGVTLAVSSIVAVHQISQRVVESLASVTPPQLVGVTHQLSRADLTMADYFQLRARWRAGELEGVSALMPIVEGSVEAGRLLGVDAFSGVPAALGLALLLPDQVLAGETSGRVAGERILSAGGSLEVARLVPGLPENLLVTDIGTAQVALGRSDDALDAIGVVVRAPSQRLIDWLDRLMPGFSAGIGFQTLDIPGWTVTEAAASEPTLAFSRSVLFNLGALGSLALVVAWLLVYQVSVIWLRRRAMTLNRLRQMGVSEAELRRVFLLNLLLLGLVSSGLGILLGDWLAGGLAGIATGFSDALPTVSVDHWLFLKATGSAVLVCLVGGWLACRREADPAAGKWPFRLVWVGLLVAGVYGLLFDGSLLGGFAAIAAAGVLTLVAIPRVLGGLKRLAVRPATRYVARRGLLARIGLREMLWHPGDLSVAIGALVLALATSVAMALMVDSFRLDFEAMLDQRVVHDVFVRGDRDQSLNDLADRLEALPGVSRVQRYGRADRTFSGRRVVVGFTRFDAREGGRYGLNGTLPQGQALVSERLARDLALAPGDVIELEAMAFPIAAVFPGYGDSTLRLILDDADAARIGLSLRYDRLSIDADDEAGVVAAVAQAAPDLEVQVRSSIRAEALKIFDQTFAITRALTLLALIVASVGLYNALLALELLQQPARRLLHTMGTTPLEQRLVAAYRVVGVGLTALLLALPLGLVMGWLLCAVINPRAFGWSLSLALSPGSFVWPVLSAMLAMLVVGLAPLPSEEAGGGGALEAGAIDGPA